MKMLSDHYKEIYGCKVYKLSLDGGFTCPNRDGTLGSKGCIFCTGSGEFAESGPDPIRVQLDRAKLRVNRKNKDGKYIRIIDYKSSVKNIDLNEVVAGIQIQLLTYLDAVSKKENADLAGVLYFNLIEPVIKAKNKNTRPIKGIDIHATRLIVTPRLYSEKISIIYVLN